MKVFVSLMALFALTSCGKSIQDRAQNRPHRNEKNNLSQAETWKILSERPLPAKVKVMINEMEFLNECTGLGSAEIERTNRNGTISINSYTAFRQEFFDVDILDCTDSSVFYSQDYVDETIIEHPKGAQLRVILRLRN